MSKPINISVPDDLYKSVKRHKQIRISSVCQKALLEAVEGEKAKITRPKPTYVETDRLGTLLEKIVECIDRLDRRDELNSQVIASLKEKSHEIKNTNRTMKEQQTEFDKWYRLAAEQGDANAQYNLGWMYHEGTEVSLDDKEAVKWWKLAAEQGDAGAQYNLGWMYYEGEGVHQDYKEVVKWWRLAAEQGHKQAQFSLGVMYDNGTGVPQNYKEAVKWWRLSAEQGDAGAQYNLGWMYHEGTKIPRDDKEAAKWWKLAAEQGDANAQFSLGWLSHKGTGIPLTAEQGDAAAKSNLGVMYDQRAGVPLGLYVLHRGRNSTQASQEKKLLMKAVEEFSNRKSNF
tara:strand:- start:858 stop:1883 length:1026 start_codon:yes stop_codon:yes gene_type:complete